MVVLTSSIVGLTTCRRNHSQSVAATKGSLSGTPAISSESGRNQRGLLRVGCVRVRSDHKRSMSIQA
jgi:hypothetical protein